MSEIGSLGFSTSGDETYTQAVSPATPTGSIGISTYDVSTANSTYGLYGEKAPFSLIFQSTYTFRSATITSAYDVVGGYDAYRGAQFAVITNYVDANNYIAASVQRSTDNWYGDGDLTLVLKVVRGGIAKALDVEYFSGRNRPDEPTKYLSLTVDPSNKRYDGLWPITAHAWSADPTDTTRRVSITKYHPDVGDGKYFDTNPGRIATAQNLPEFSGSYTVEQLALNYGTKDSAEFISTGYSLEADPDIPPEPTVTTTLQGILLTLPFALETITRVVYEVSSASDASSWSPWTELADLTLASNVDGSYTHRTTTLDSYYRYRATYYYRASDTTIRATAKSDYVVAGQGVLTAGGILDKLPVGVELPVQTPTTGNEGITNETLRWSDASLKQIIATDYTRIRGTVGTSSLITSRNLSVYHPATPLYEQAKLTIEANTATPLIRVTAGDYSKVVLDSSGKSELGGGGTGDVGTGRLFFFI